MGSINSILPLLMFVLLGFFIKRYLIKSIDFWSNINKLLYYIMFPSFLVYNISIAKIGNINLSFVFILIFISGFLIALILLCRKLFSNQDFWLVFFQGSFRYNSYIFISLVIYKFGINSMPIVAIITVFLVIFSNIVSVFIFNKYAQIRISFFKNCLSILFNPLIIACILGVVINRLAIAEPSIISIAWLNSFLNDLGISALTLSLINIGANLKLKFDNKKIVGVLICSLIKLVLLPAVVLIALLFFNYSYFLISICVIYAACPCSSNCISMVEEFSSDCASMSLIVSTQTCLSLLTLPAWLFVLHYNAFI